MGGEVAFMIALEVLEYRRSIGKRNGVARIVLRVTESEVLGACNIDLCLIDECGGPHYASGVLRFNETVASMRLKIDSIPPGRCDGYLLLRCSNGRFELPPVSLEVDR